MDQPSKYVLELAKKANITPSEVSSVWNQGEFHTVPANAIFNDELGIDSCGFLITKGVARKFLIDNNGKEHTIDILNAPSFTSIALRRNLLDQSQMTKLQALTKLEIRSWPVSFIMSLIEKNPSYNKILIEQITNALLRKNIKHIRRRALSTDDQYLEFMNNYPGVINKVPLKYIASFLGMTPETISRIRSRMRNK